MIQKSMGGGRAHWQMRSCPAARTSCSTTGCKELASLVCQICMQSMLKVDNEPGKPGFFLRVSEGPELSEEDTDLTRTFRIDPLDRDLFCWNLIPGITPKQSHTYMHFSCVKKWVERMSADEEKAFMWMAVTTRVPKSELFGDKTALQYWTESQLRDLRAIPSINDPEKSKVDYWQVARQKLIDYIKEDPRKSCKAAAKLGFTNDRRYMKKLLYYDLQYASEIGPWLRDQKKFMLPYVQLRKRAFLQYAGENLRSDSRFVLEAVRANGLNLHHASNALRRDRDVVLTAVENDGMSLEYASDALKNDDGVVLEAVTNDGMSLKYASPALQNDKALVLEAVKNNGMSLKHASPALRNDERVVLEAVKNDGMSLKHASAALQDDERVVLKAVKDNGMSLEYASDALKNNAKVVMKAVSNDGRGLQHASEAAKDDPEIVGKAMEDKVMNLRFASGRIRGDPELALHAFREDSQTINFAVGDALDDANLFREVLEELPSKLKMASDRLKKDPELVGLAFSKDESTLEFAHDDLLTDHDFMVEMVKLSPTAVEHAKFEHFQDVNRFIRDCALVDPEVVRYLPTRYRRDDDVLNDVVSAQPFCLRFLHPDTDLNKSRASSAVKAEPLCLLFCGKFRGDKDVVVDAVSGDGMCLVYADESLRDDRDVVLEAVRDNGAAMQFASETLKRDREFVLACIGADHNSFLHVDDSLQEDDELVAGVLSRGKGMLAFVPERFRKSYNTVHYAVKHDPMNLQYADLLHMGENKAKSVVMSAVRKDGHALRWAPDHCRKDRKVARAAVGRSARAFQWVKGDLRNDHRLVETVVWEDASMFRYAGEAVREDVEFAKKLSKMNPEVVQYFDGQLAELAARSARGKRDYVPLLPESAKRRIKKTNRYFKQYFGPDGQDLYDEQKIGRALEMQRGQ